jgi:phosphoribosylanthranilate isomerase
MTGVKICGLRRKEDIAFVNRYMPEYIGFVFAKSRRQVTREQAVELRKLLLPGIKATGVFVNENIDAVADIACFSGLDIIQLHGDESPEYVEKMRKSLYLRGKKDIFIWKAIRVKDEGSFENVHKYRVDAYLLDAYLDGSYGGAGISFDWSLAVTATKYCDVILAGGINISNVRQAIERVKPFAVDVSSGVETDGFKDEVKIRGFIENVRGVMY